VGARVLVDEVYLDMCTTILCGRAFILRCFVVTNSLTRLTAEWTAVRLDSGPAGAGKAHVAIERSVWSDAVHPGDLLSVMRSTILRKSTRAPAESSRSIAVRSMDSLPDEAIWPDSAAHGNGDVPRLTHGSVKEFIGLLRTRFEPASFLGVLRYAGSFPDRIGGDPAMTAAALERLAEALDEYGSKMSL